MDNRRTTIVINKKFQYQYSLLIAAVAVILVNAFIIVRILFPGEHALALTSGTTLSLAAVELILLASLWYASLKASHRIAGPVYVFAREIGKLGEGDLTASIKLRSKDMFQPEAIAMNASIAALRSKICSLKALSEQLNQAQSSGADSSKIVQQLSAELSTLITETEG
jgi:methyl-accepting chemotaxis protein